MDILRTGLILNLGLNVVRHPYIIEAQPAPIINTAEMSNAPHIDLLGNDMINKTIIDTAKLACDRVSKKYAESVELTTDDPSFIDNEILIREIDSYVPYIKFCKTTNPTVVPAVNMSILQQGDEFSTSNFRIAYTDEVVRIYLKPGVLLPGNFIVVII